MPQMSRAEALNILGLPHFATQSDIRAARRRLVFAMHPDKRVGSDAKFARVNEAYDVLNKGKRGSRPDYTEWADPMYARHKAVRGADVSAPRRHAIKTRLVDLSDDARVLCEALLDGGDLEGAVRAAIEHREVSGDERSSKALKEGDHIPGTVRMRGRRVSYFVGQPLVAGANRVAVPSGELEGRGRVDPKLVSFSVANAGTGKVELSEKVREAMFPGARSVRIHFAEA